MTFMKVPPQDCHNRIVAQAFDRRNATAFSHDSKNQTGARGFSIHIDRTRAASAMFAAEMCSGQR
jgi:hypothetical protein